MFAFRKVIPFLTPKYRVCAVDLRGFGDSERPTSGYDCGTMASDLIKVADAAGFDKFRVVGEDWGAAYAYTLAAASKFKFGVVPVDGFGSQSHADDLEYNGYPAVM